MSKADGREYDYSSQSSGNGNSAGKSSLDPFKVKKAAAVIRAINHPLRQSMIRLLEEQRRMTVTELYNRLNLEQSVASQHLAILREARVVITSRNGKFIHYSVSEKRLRDLNAFVEQIIAL
jgi:DNA-binding transcriptional ArsR family regulator